MQQPLYAHCTLHSCSAFRLCLLLLLCLCRLLPLCFSRTFTFFTFLQTADRCNSFTTAAAAAAVSSGHTAAAAAAVDKKATEKRERESENESVCWATNCARTVKDCLAALVRRDECVLNWCVCVCAFETTKQQQQVTKCR